MLTPKEPAQPAEANRIISARLGEGETARLDWLTDRLNMSRSELMRALINQEYMTQLNAQIRRGDPFRAAEHVTPCPECATELAWNTEDGLAGQRCSGCGRYFRNEDND